MDTNSYSYLLLHLAPQAHPTIIGQQNLQSDSNCDSNATLNLFIMAIFKELLAKYAAFGQKRIAKRAQEISASSHSAFDMLLSTNQ